MQLRASLFCLLSLCFLGGIGRSDDRAWLPLFDGKTLEGWDLRQGSAQVVEGRLEISKKAALYNRGDVRLGMFDYFDFQTDVLTEPGASADIAFEGTLNMPQDIRVAINNSRNWTDGQPKTGSLWEVRRQFKSMVRDGQWFKLRIRRDENGAAVWVNDTLLAERSGRLGGSLTIRGNAGPAKVCFKNVRVLHLTNAKSGPIPAADTVDADIRRLTELERAEFPLLNTHIHLKGDLTLEKALQHSRETGVFYGIAANCGVYFPITTDAGIDEYIKKMEGQPCFIGMQAEGREWPTLFTKKAIARFDYIFTDAMTIVDHCGKRARLWMPEEVDIPDKQAFMELLVHTIETILDNEPVDIYANPTYLPDSIVEEYDALWTAPRVKRVIDAAARNGVAIEISNRLKLPKADFILQAKKAGVKFTLGTNNIDSKLGREEYGVQMIRECELKPADMFLPKPDGKKPVQLRGKG